MHPIFEELALANRNFDARLRAWLQKWKAAQETLGPNAPAKRQEAILLPLLDERDALIAKSDTSIESIYARHGDPPCKSAAFAYLWPSETQVATLQPEPHPLFRLLHWLRFADRVETSAAKDAEGDLDAYDQLTRTGEDYRRADFAKGPIKPFKHDDVHRFLFELVSCYENERLTAEELASCFDELCGCGVKEHDAGSLRKQYARLKADLNRVK